MCMMSDGQISTQCPQPSQLVMYTNVGMNISLPPLAPNNARALGGRCPEFRFYLRRAVGFSLNHLLPRPVSEGPLQVCRTCARIWTMERIRRALSWQRRTNRGPRLSTRYGSPAEMPKADLASRSQEAKG